jgi:hypothetical protein
MINFKIEKLPTNVQYTLISTISLIPYNFIALNLFKSNIPINNLYFIISLLFCFSLTYVLCTYLAVYFTLFIYHVKEEIATTSEKLTSQTVKNCNIVSLIYISISLLLSYIISLFFCEFKFIYFVILSYLVLVVRILSDIYFSKKEKKTKIDTIE